MRCCQPRVGTCAGVRNVSRADDIGVARFHTENVMRVKYFRARGRGAGCDGNHFTDHPAGAKPRVWLQFPGWRPGQ